MLIALCAFTRHSVRLVANVDHVTGYPIIVSGEQGGVRGKRSTLLSSSRKTLFSFDEQFD